MSLPAPEPSTTVVITGASSGIGTELARQLAERGYNPVLVARPGFLWQSAADCARDGIEGMLHGRRTVVPRITNKVTAQAGRLTPRSVLLPVMRAVYGRG